MACVVYLNNRSPTLKKKLMQMTPQEAWSGKKLNISHLRVFGSIGYVTSWMIKVRNFYLLDM